MTLENDPWTEFDLQDLKKYSKEFEKKYTGDKLIKVIAFKLRRNEEDVKEKMIELGTISIPITDPTYYPSLYKEQNREDDIHLVRVKTKAITQSVIKKSTDEIPDLGELLIKIKNDISLLHQDAHSLEITIIAKMDDLIAAVNKNSLLKKEELTIIKEQYAVWKQKQTPIQTSIEKGKPLDLSLFGGVPKQ
jgi:hypothetical protein